MAYRRRQQGITKSSTFKEEPHHRPSVSESQGLLEYAAATTKPKLTPSHTFNSSSTVAADAIRASASHLNQFDSPIRSNKIFDAYEDRSPMSGSKGFWGVLARKAKSILEDEENQHHDANKNNNDDVVSPQPASAAATSRFHMSSSNASPPAAAAAAASAGIHQSHSTPEGLGRKMDNPAIKNRLDKITTSLNHIGDTFDKAFEEGRTMVGNKTADIIQETRKLQARRKGGVGPQQQEPSSQPEKHMNPETQLKASRDVAMATAAKAKLLLRELKTVKADLAFAKQRCSQLEEENKMLRESREKGGNPADDDLIRLQLETLLAEKARLANENAFYARENCYLREIVEYHQLTMQDVVYLDEGSEEVSEVYPMSNMMSMSPPLSPMSPPSSSASGMTPTATESCKEVFPMAQETRGDSPGLDDVARFSATRNQGSKSDSVDEKEGAGDIIAPVIQEEQTPKRMSISTA